MISRRTSLILGEIYQIDFSGSVRNSENYPRSDYYETKIFTDRLYDYLYERDYEAWFCNQAQALYRRFEAERQRAIKEWILKLHTGETIATTEWTWKQREQLGQRYLSDLAKDILIYKEASSGNLLSDKAKELKSSLELDGYLFRDKQLLFSESAVLDVVEETGVLQSLYTELLLDNKQVFEHHLELSEQNYIAKHWGDVITNARNALECVLKEAAAAHSRKLRNNSLSEKTLDRPVDVRDYLEREGLLEKKEKEALSSIYGLLSNTGSHPYIAENDQARLMRNLALTFSQFVMLRYQGVLKKSVQTPAT